ncbi:unnamed protein product [Rotaria magnacalcarata]|uniref:Uncharacterized protein n=1 Tax=Rotaria magnacalcarata TaxID=392030 RepID=A0A816C475_9BILA|nr:unnamed protein product [Rotaria magnacalcarata]CAF1615613.1 unnamed protein product [Rotaria magnacalcarata]CAF4006791.1 unnamed protein product [Rotaria magnacalcarata]CAF4573559.1 unnamed protein product [Rotaria magnacalcarata]
MGSNNGKQDGSKENNKRRTTFRRILQASSRQPKGTSRPVSYAGINQYYEEHHHHNSTRPMSMINVVPCGNLERRISNHNHNITANEIEADVKPILRSSSQSITTNEFSEQTSSTNEDDIERTMTNNSIRFDENDWKSYIPLTLEQVKSITILKDLIYERINPELIHILNRLIQIQNVDEHERFLNWFFNEIEYCLDSIDDDGSYCHKPLLLYSIEQDRFDCTKYLLEHHLLPSKLDINTINEQGRHCLLMLSHKNGPVDLIKYLLKHHLSCLDTNKIDLNSYSSLHHACRHFNLSLCEILLPYTNKQTLQIENSELHTPLDYWLECLCSLKKLKPTHIQYNIDDLRLNHILDNSTDYHGNIYFLQAIIDRGGQLTKFPLRYIRSILPQLSFEQKLYYVDHHVNICCILYKNRLSTLMHNYDEFKTSVQASEILTELIFSLGTVQVEIQNRLAENACSQLEQALKIKQNELLQSTLRALYGKFFRLFECIYNNPDVNVKNFHFEHIFRHVWIYWKEPVNAFIQQSKGKSVSLKAICRKKLFQRIMNYPNDIQNLPINSFLKQYIAFNNQFFVVQRKF